MDSRDLRRLLAARWFNDHGTWIHNSHNNITIPTILGFCAKVSAGLESLLLSSVKNHFNLHRSNPTHALLLSTYGALFFFLSASFSWFILTKKFGVFPVWASWKSDSIRWRHGSKLSWIWVIRHCEFSS